MRFMYSINGLILEACHIRAERNAVILLLFLPTFPLASASASSLRMLIAT